jgi:hypothetical protein
VTWDKGGTGFQKIQHSISSVRRGTVLHKPVSANKLPSCHKLGYKVNVEHMQISLAIDSFTEENWSDKLVTGNG